MADRLAPSRQGASAAEQELLGWLSGYVAGRPGRLETDAALTDILVHSRLTELVASHGGGDAAALRASFVRAVNLERVSRACLAVLSAAGIPATTLKGPALAARFWGDPVARVSGDVDLLVAPRLVAAAIAAFEAAGFRRSDDFPDWYEPRWHYHAVLRGPAPEKVPLELHWGISRPGLARIDVAAIVAGSVPVRCLAGDLPAPTPPWQLLVAALHATRHQFPLREVLDVALVSRALSEPEWAIAAREARRAAIGPCLYYSLLMVERRFGLELHRSVIELRPSRLRQRIVLPFLDALPVSGPPDRAALQMGKVAVPLATSSLGRLPVGVARSLSDRPRVARWIDRRLGCRDSVL